MKINYELITTAIQTAQAIFNQQTADDLVSLKEHFGKAYGEVSVVSEIAVKLILRIGGVQLVSDGRELSPVDSLVYDAIERYNARYRG